MKVLHCLWTLMAIATIVRGQEPVAPTWEPVGNPRGSEYGGYNISNSFELGQRFLGLSGNEANYQAAVNYGNGPRLLSSSLSIFSKSGLEKLFDSIVLTTQGLGGDPFQTVSLRVKQRKFYSYVATWRDSEYVNPGLVTDGGTGSNALSTSYASQSHDLILMPESHVRWLLGYRRDSQDGLGLTTELGPDGSVDLFPVLSHVHRVRNEYRAGVELHWRNSMLRLLRGWSDFKDDSPYGLPAKEDGSVTDFSRAAPAHATNPSWTLLFLHRDQQADISGNFTYANGEGSFVSDESIFSSGFLATPTQQIQTSGTGRQPVATGNLNIDVDVVSNLTLTSHTSFYDGRTEGANSYFSQLAPGQVSPVLYFQSLDIRTVTTDLQADQRVNEWLDLFGGYEHSSRLIDSVEQVTFSGNLIRTPFSQTNEENDGFFGLKIRAVKSLTLSAEGEISHSSLPFTPKSDGNYVAWKASLTYRLKNLQLSASAQTERNATSTSLTSFSSRNQTWSATATWTARPWLSFDGSYSNIYTNVLGGLAFFAGGLPVDDAVSYYIMNLHAANAGVRMQVRSLTIYLGGTAVRDSGDGRAQADMSQYDPNLEAFRVPQTFPLTYYSPFARLSVKLNQALRWNIGYQLYTYQAVFAPALNFNANTAFTSLSWSF